MAMNAAQIQVWYDDMMTSVRQSPEYKRVFNSRRDENYHDVARISRRSFLGSLMASAAVVALAVPRRAADRALYISYGERMQTISWSDVSDSKTWTTSGAWSMPAEDFRKAVIYLPPRYAMSDLPAYAFPKWSIGS